MDKSGDLSNNERSVGAPQELASSSIHNNELHHSHSNDHFRHLQPMIQSVVQLHQPRDKHDEGSPVRVISVQPPQHENNTSVSEGHLHQLASMPKTGFNSHRNLQKTTTAHSNLLNPKKQQ